MWTLSSTWLHHNSIYINSLLRSWDCQIFISYCLDSQSKHCILMPPWSIILQRLLKDPGSNYVRHSHFIAFLWYNLCPEKQNIGFLRRIRTPPVGHPTRQFQFLRSQQDWPLPQKTLP